jgi:hypothetical protein
VCLFVCVSMCVCVCVKLLHFLFNYNKPTTRTNFSNLFWNETLHVSDSSSVQRQQFFTVRTAMVYVIEFWRQLSSSRISSILILLHESCLQTCMTYTIAVCTVKISWWWTEELSESCRVSFQNKFEKSVRLVGFIIKIKVNSFKLFTNSLWNIKVNTEFLLYWTSAISSSAHKKYTATSRRT